MTVGSWGFATDRGRVRVINEDALLADPPVFIVADGMGGHAAGDVASQTTVEAFARLVGRGPVTAQEAVAAISDANRSILKIAATSPEKVGMGTTLSGLISVQAGGSEHWMIVNVGDSRVYRLLGTHLEQLTVDHSEAEEMVAAGRLSREEARSYGRRNIVTRSLGTEPEPIPDSWVFPPSPGERFLICSDGLTTEVADTDIESCLNSQSDAQMAADQLVQLALGGGAKDNITVIVVDGIAASLDSSIDEDTAPRGNHGS
jgi:serine/threonine protein phosphatase PrpC